jgi:hypothetical protein
LPLFLPPFSPALAGIIQEYSQKLESKHQGIPKALTNVIREAGRYKPCSKLC